MVGSLEGEYEGWLVGKAVGAGVSINAWPLLSPAKPILDEYKERLYSDAPTAIPVTETQL